MSNPITIHAFRDQHRTSIWQSHLDSMDDYAVAEHDAQNPND